MSLSKGLTRTRLGMAVGCSLTILGSCGGTNVELDPQADLEVVQPVLDHLVVRSFQAPTGLMIWVEGASTRALAENEAIKVEMSSSRGGIAEVVVPRSTCGPSGQLYVCRQLSMVMKPGRAVRDLDAFLSELDAGIISIAVIGSVETATVEVFSGSPATVLEHVRNHDAVDDADRTGTGVPGAELPHDLDQYVVAILPTLDLDPTPPSAELLLLAGDTVTVRYRQPDGSYYADTAVIQ